MRNRMCLLLLASACLVVQACGGKETTGSSPTPPSGETKQLSPSAAPAPLPASGYRVQWTNVQLPSDMLAGKEYIVTATIKNASDQTWSAKGTGGGLNQVAISYHWLPAQGEKVVVWDAARTWFPHDVAAGETIDAGNIRVVAPNDAGSYRLQLTLVHEGVSWFETRGASTFIAPVTVR